MVDVSQRGVLAQRRLVGSNRGEWQWGGVLCAPLYAPAPPPTSPLCPHPHILIHSASPSTLPATPQSIGFVTALCLRWIYAEREAKADPCRWESSGLLGWLEPFLSLYNLSCVS